MRIAVKEVGKDLVILDTKQKYITNCAKDYIGQDEYPERVHLGPQLDICVNEDGLRQELPVNFLLETTSAYWPIQKMVGTVVFVRTKPVDPCREIYDYEVDDLTDQDIEHIRFLISEETQARLNSRFQDYGKGAFVIKSL